MSLMSAMMPAGVRRSVKLHPYQQNFVDSVEESWKTYRKTMAVLAVGGGKTICAGELVAREVERGGRCLVLAHTIDLVAQFQRSLENNYGLWVTMDGGGQRSEDSPVVCSTVQSMSNRIDRGVFGKDAWTLVIVDECHRLLGGQHMKAVEFFDSAKFLGVTATPVRSDQKCLMQVIEDKCYDLPITTLIHEGYLSRIEIVNAPVEIRVESSSKTGDFKDEEVGAALDAHLEACAKIYTQHGRGRCGIIFLPLIRTSIAFTNILKSMGMKADHIDGTASPEERRDIQRRLEMGDLDCICNSLLFSEGWDCRPVDLLMNLRCTKSWTLQTQIIGRITRTYDPALHGPKGTRWNKKEKSTILDVTWMVDDYNMLQRPASFIAKDKEEAEEIQKFIKKAQAGGGGADLLDAMEGVTNEREERLKQRLEAVSKRKSRLVSAMEFFSQVHLPELADYQPLNDLEARPITALSDAQRDWLTRSKIDLSSVSNFGQAKHILDALGDRAKRGLATLAQVKFAESLDFEGKTGKKPMEASFAEMSDFLNRNSPPRPAWLQAKMKGRR